MSMFNRYSFTKGIYGDYLVIIKRKNRYYSFGNDKGILDYIGFRGKLYILKRYGINYIILDDLEIIDMGNFIINNYYRYLYLSYIKRILFEMRGCICK